MEVNGSSTLGVLQIGKTNRWLFNHLSCRKRHHPRPFRASHRQNMSTPTWWRGILIDFIMFVRLPCWSRQLRRYFLRETQLDVEISGGGRPRWLNLTWVTPLGSVTSAVALWHLYQGVQVDWLVSKRGQSNLIFLTVRNQRCLLNWISGLESREQILERW